MKISGHQIEWSYESIAAWPYAYWAHTHGLLTETESGPDSSCVYWYSPKHTIRTDERSWDNMKLAGDLPNLWIHKPRLDKSKWTPPPLKEHFATSSIKFAKPTVVIANRVNSEWNRGMINYFDLPTLRSLFEMLQKKYQIVYLNVRGKPELEDTAKAIDIGDYDMIRKDFPSVKIIHDIIENGSFNETQCRVFAGCDRFITMCGGYSTMCSYFGGENIIYAKECKELWPTVNSFYNWYPDFGGSVIKVVNTYKDLLDIVHSKWVAEQPLINILVRCKDREQGLERLYKSLDGQTYKNWRVIASYENESTWKYLCKYPFEKIKVIPTPRPEVKPPGEEYARFLHANLYFNEMMERVNQGWIMHLDDDDYFKERAGLSGIARNLDKYKLTLWKAGRMGTDKTIPNADYFGKIEAGHISGIAFAFHHKHKHMAQWEPWRRGDYRVIKRLSEYMKCHFVDDVFTIIGHAPPEKGTKEYINKKAQDHKAKIDMINAQVAEKLAARKAATMQGVPTAPTPHSCPTCGQPIPEKAP